ncbi:MAG: response regulator [Persicimonas sp.]
MGERVLVVEDEENVRESVAALLEVEGLEVITADNGARALALLRSEPDVSLIILDLMMPQMDGWAFRARQLNQPELRDIPVVVLSGAREIDREVKEMEPEAVLRKPVSIQELLDILDEILGEGVLASSRRGVASGQHDKPRRNNQKK